MDLDIPLLLSAVLNIVLVVVVAWLARKGMDLGALLSKASTKAALIASLVNDFVVAYQDKVITKEEAQKLIDEINKLIKDP